MANIIKNLTLKDLEVDADLLEQEEEKISMHALLLCETKIMNSTKKN